MEAGRRWKRPANRRELKTRNSTAAAVCIDKHPVTTVLSLSRLVSRLGRRLADEDFAAWSKSDRPPAEISQDTLHRQGVVSISLAIASVAFKASVATATMPRTQCRTLGGPSLDNMYRVVSHLLPQWLLLVAMCGALHSLCNSHDTMHDGLRYGPHAPQSRSIDMKRAHPSNTTCLVEANKRTCLNRFSANRQLFSTCVKRKPRRANMKPSCRRTRWQLGEAMCTPTRRRPVS